MKRNTMNLIFVFMCLSVSIAFSQIDSTSNVRLKLDDNSELFGRIISETDSFYYFQTYSNIHMQVHKMNVVEIEELNKIDSDRGLYVEDPNDSRLFIGPTARNLKSGSGYFSAYEIFFPYLSCGLTDYLSFSIGLSLIPAVPLDKQLLYFSPKATLINQEYFQFSVGCSYMSIVNEGFGIAYTVATIGGKSRAFTLGLGKPFSRNASDAIVFLLGGEVQISNSIKIISENWVLPDNLVIFSGGLRFFGRKLSGDFGLFSFSKGTTGSPVFPYIGFTYSF